jgi:hypothetical protein
MTPRFTTSSKLSIRSCGHGTFLLPARFWRNLTTPRNRRSPYEAGTQRHVCGHGRRGKAALWSVLEFRSSGWRNAEHRVCRLQLFNWEKFTLHVQPKAWRKFRLKGKKKPAKDRFIPIPAKLVWKIKERMRERDAQPHDLVFPNGEGKPDGHFLRK